MFVIMLHYKKPLAEVDKFLTEHRNYLEQGYQKNYYITSGPRNPRTGGIILSQLQDKQQLEKILEQDPFYINDLVEYEIIEFIPVKYHADFKAFI
jgi:uncharacterized protein YciI